jgi:hypothetical protein
MVRTVVEYQDAKAEVTDAIQVVKACAERLEKADDFSTAFYDLLEALDYLDRTFEGFAYDNIPGAKEE